VWQRCSSLIHLLQSIVILLEGRVLGIKRAGGAVFFESTPPVT
jgi:hypothetical protein